MFLTSKLLYKALLNDAEKRYSAQYLYKIADLIPIPAEANKLGQPMIPLFRHNAYALKTHPDYIQRVKAWLLKWKNY